MLVIALLVCAFVVPSLSAECQAQIGSTYCTNWEEGFGGIWGNGCTKGVGGSSCQCNYYGVNSGSACHCNDCYTQSNDCWAPSSQWIAIADVALGLCLSLELCRSA